MESTVATLSLPVEVHALDLKKGKHERRKGEETGKNCGQNGTFQGCCPEKTVVGKTTCLHSQKILAFCRNP
jgi:hypothetical protein